MNLPYLTARALPYLAWLFRRIRPVLFLGDKVFVLRAKDVIKVLESPPEVMAVAEINADKMARTSGEFILGMDNREKYARETGMLAKAFDRTEVVRLREICLRHTREAMEAADKRGGIEVVGDLARLVPLKVVQDYFGVPGPGLRDLERWLKDQFNHLFFNLGGDREIERKALLAASEMRPYLDKLIGARRQTPAIPPVTVLDRMLGIEDDDFIKRTLAGMILGVVETTAKAATNVIDWFLSHPRALRSLRRQIEGGERLPPEFALEALRFNPVNPVIARYCRQNLVLDEADPGSFLPRGKVVLASTLSAMFDPERFPAPFVFDPGRPARSYLHFGWDRHKCQGDHLAPEMLSIMVGEFFRGGRSWERVPGPSERVRYDGFLVHSLALRRAP